MMILLEFVVFFFLILVLGYLIPAGRYYLTYQVWDYKDKEARRLQDRRPTREGIMREVKLSLISITIFAVMATATYQLYKAGHTSIYLNVSDYPLIWWPISILVCMVIHDTYFYWTHRLMHWRPMFKYTHAGHHKSVSPTPWAIYAFQPAEAIIQFAGVCAMVIFLPLHVFALTTFLWFDTQMNSAGHSGYEIIPRYISDRFIFKGFNTVSHHDAHHTNMTKNFGSFFNLWDRMMGTFLDATPADRTKSSAGHASAPHAAAPHQPDVQN